HHFLAVTKQGRSAIAATTGNRDCHVILRGGSAGPNHDAAGVDGACAVLAKAGLRPQVMIDASHANSGKDPEKQPKVLQEIGAQVAAGDHRITGVMVESHLVGGAQKTGQGPLVYGQSITDGCLGWAETETALHGLADAVRMRRGRLARKAG
ncbi:MAG: 3-deoxy-7-phosphoheptulonate synthase, partial [Roseovarius indicus]